MEHEKVRIGKHVIDLAAIASIHWEGEKLFIHLSGGRFLSLVGNDGQLLWNAYQAGAIDLASGEVLDK